MITLILKIYLNANYEDIYNIYFNFNWHSLMEPMTKIDESKNFVRNFILVYCDYFKEKPVQSKTLNNLLELGKECPNY